MSFRVGQPFSGAGTPITLDGNDQYILAAGITVHSTNNAALQAGGANNTIDVEGTLIGVAGLVMDSGTVNIADSGVVAGAGASGTGVDGIRLLTGASALFNRGLILGELCGIRVSSDASASVINYGRIISEFEGIACDATGTIATKLQNFGTITGLQGDAFRGTGTGDSVINKGQINGNVNLGGGNDIYDGNGGRVKGWIWGDAGTDTLSGGASADLIYGGVGNDRITGRGGRDDLWGDDTATLAVNAGKDTFDFNAISESGTTASKRDIIRDFNNGNDRIDLSTIDANTTIAGNQAFTVLAKGTATSAVGTGKIGWYWIDSSNNANDRTIIRINNDADAAADMTIELVGLKNLSRTGGVDFVL